MKQRGQGTESLVMTGNRLNKPFILRTAWNSSYRQNEFQFFEVHQLNPDVRLDFSDQVKMSEATFDALNDYEIKNVIKGIIIQQYFWIDQFNVFHPPTGSIVPASGDKSPNIRNKPAEKLIKLWFKY